MNLKKIYYLVLCALVACTTASCKDSNDDYIPPALEPEKPEVPVEPACGCPHSCRWRALHHLQRVADDRLSRVVWYTGRWL